MKVEPTWPFDDPPNVAVFTTTQVIRDGRPILHVAHDDEDGAWQFHSNEPIRSSDTMIVSLSEVMAHDPSLAVLADLPLGGSAERSGLGQPWLRRAVASASTSNKVSNHED